MNLRERRSTQRKGWIGYILLAALPFGGIMLLSGRISLFFVVVVAALLVSLVTAAFALLVAKLRFSARERRLLAAEELP